MCTNDAPIFATHALQQLVHAILRRKSGMSLRPDDMRADNVDTLELCQDVLVRLWERFSADEGLAWNDMQAYAATVAHNAWSDHLRRKYPRRASLKSRLRHFLGHQPRYALWTDARGETLGGLRGWAAGTVAADPARLQALEGERPVLPPGSRPARPPEQCSAEDWDRLLRALFYRAGGPMTLDALVGLVARLLDLREDTVESLDLRIESEGQRSMADAGSADPEQQALLRDLLRQVWEAVQALKPAYRQAYLLNLPGPGKLRSDIEVFVMHGIASTEEIRISLGLSPQQLDLALAASPLTVPQRRQAMRASEADRFALLWAQLPLSDALIGDMTGLAQQQVINRRMLALRELARRIGADSPRATRRSTATGPATRAQLSAVEAARGRSCDVPAP